MRPQIDELERAKSLDECRREIQRLRAMEPDFDVLYVDALTPAERKLVARLYCQFRAPFRCGVQTGEMLNHDFKWQYRFSIEPHDPAQALHSFMSEYSQLGFEVALSYSDDHDKVRDRQLRAEAESAADLDAETETKLEAILSASDQTQQETTGISDAAAPAAANENSIVPAKQSQPSTPQKQGKDHEDDRPHSRRKRLLEAADDYRARGWPVLRLAGKRATDKAWSRSTADGPMPSFDDSSNIGILLGDPSGGLVRPDFEWPAPNIASALFLEPLPRFGRRSARGTGLLIVSKGAKSKRYALPDSISEDPRLPSRHDDRLLVCELLSTGKQTMAPPSVHPDTQEEVEWEDYPAAVPELSPDELYRRMGLYAFLATIAHFWTGDEHGYWYERGLALTGVLLEVLSRLPEEQRIASVDQLVKATARDGGDTDWHKRSYAAATLEKINAGQPTMGLPRLTELNGLPAKVTDTFRSWLELEGGSNPDLEQMNRDHAAGRVKGKFRVVSWLPDARYPRQRLAEFSSHDDFCHAVVNPKIVIPTFDKEGKKTGTRRLARGAWWLSQDGRAEFDGIDYVPGAPEIIQRHSPGGGRALTILNMYSGFSIEPDYTDSERKCSLYLTHVRDNICSGDEELNRYVLDWMASGVQQPENPGRSALSMRGDPGAGKGVFATEYGHLYGRHFLHVTNRDHVTGKFNAHSAETCLQFVDEALYAEIMSDARILKTLVSETTKILERKGIDAIQIDNYARLIFSTNDKHPLQIEHNDRRYCAIYVRTNPLWANEPNKRRAAEKRRGYFKPLLDQMKNGGRAALLGYLLRRDISAFNSEAIPETVERSEQKLMSAPAGDKVIIEFAMDGILPGALAKRPWIARANGEGCLYPTMRQRGGRHLAHQSDMALSDLVKGWNFTRHPLGDGAAWAAPALADLRAAIDAKYPGIEWDTRVTEWGQAPKDFAASKEQKDDGIPF